MFGFKVHFKCLIIFIYKLSLQKMAKAHPEPDTCSSESSEDDDDVTPSATPGIREFLCYIVSPEATLTFRRSVGLILTVVYALNVNLVCGL